METTLTSEAIDGLAQKLDEFSQVLSDDEKAILLTIFRLGSNALGEVGRQVETESGAMRARPGMSPAFGPSGGTPPIRLSESLKNAFTPALARGLTGINVAASGVEVTGGVKWSA